MKFILNQQIVKVDAPLGSSTLDYLRRKGLTGVKEACHEGECGACMILLGELDGTVVKYKAVTSCILPLGEVIGKHVVTIEGLNQEDLNPIQEALVEHGAVQCGFCTPGMIMSAKALLDENKNPSEDDIRTAIAGNLCRCTGYVQIIEAIKKASERREP